jgi:NADH-quinone oxidoreductase subunit L
VSAADLLLVAVVVVPAAVGLVLVPSGRSRWATAAAGWVGVGTLAAAAAASVPAVRAGARVGTDFVAGAELGLAATGPAVVLLPVVLGVAALVLVAATATAETREPRFTGLMLLFAAAAALTVLATSLPALLLGWELMGAASYALIGYRYAESRRVDSGLTAFLTTRAADLGLYAAVGAALAGGTDLSLASLATLDPGWRDVAAAGVLVAGLGKAAQLPFSFWLARAMDGPSPVSALLHSAAMVALGGYLLLRLSPLLGATGWAAGTAAWAGVTTAVLLGAVAVVQSDLKQLLAASTTAQLGFVVLAAGVGATAAGTAHLVAHAAVKALLFLAAGAWLEALGSKQLPALLGAARRWPALGALAVAAFLALAGLPPLSLWATKDAVLATALEHSPALYVAGLVATALAAAYAVTALVVVLRGDPAAATGLDAEEPGTRAVAPRVVVALVPLAVVAVAGGVLALPRVLARLPGSAPVEPTGAELVLSSLVVLASAALVVALAARRRAPVPEHAPRLLTDWLGLEAVAHTAVVRPCLRAAGVAARVDDRVLARGVGAIAAGTLRAASAAVRGDARLAGGVDAVGAGARRTGRAVRRGAASGQLHHYYLQLVVGVLVTLAVVVVVLLAGSPR